MGRKNYLLIAHVRAVTLHLVLINPNLELTDYLRGIDLLRCLLRSRVVDDGAFGSVSSHVILGIES